jgi:phosphoribulokinase
MGGAFQGDRVLLGIVGDSAAGKTTLTRGIADILGEDRVTVICSDDYHRYGRRRRAELDITPLHPECNHLDILAQHLRLLRAGQPILKPVYNHTYGELDPPEYVEPREFVIIEGLHGFATRHLRESFDVKVFLDPPVELRSRWKVRRDMDRRGYREEQVLAEMRRREPDSKEFIAPQRAYADLVVTFYPPSRQHADDQHLNVRLVLRPSLVHPNLEPVVGNGDGAIRLHMGRDEGRPVDFVEIDGSVPADEARRVEEAIYHHFRLGRGDLPEGMGMLEDGRSDPLALTQLLVTGHLIDARAAVLV